MPTRRKGNSNESAHVVHKRGVTGTIRIYNADKGWGFVDGDETGTDIFLHSKHFVDGAPTFWIGHKANTKDRDKAARTPGSVKVMFDLSTSNDGKPQAVNVKVIGENSDDESNAPPPPPPLVLGEGDSPTCARCGSTVAKQLNIEACTLCGEWLPDAGMGNPHALVPCFPGPPPFGMPPMHPGMPQFGMSPPWMVMGPLPPAMHVGVVAPPEVFPAEMDVGHERAPEQGTP